MARMIVQLKINNLEAFKKRFAQTTERRKKAGCLQEKIFVDADGDGQILIIFKWDSKEKAEKYIQSQPVQDDIDTAGFIASPLMILIEDWKEVPVEMH